MKNITEELKSVQASVYYLSIILNLNYETNILV